MPCLCHSTAVATPFAGVVGIHYIQSDFLIKTSTHQYFLEFEERHPEDFSVELLAFAAESLEVLNRNVSIKLECKGGNFPHYFSKPVFDKVVFVVLEPAKILSGFSVSFISKGLELGTPFHEFLSSIPNVLAKIGLIVCFAFRRKDGDSKAFGIHINTKNVLVLKEGFFFVEISNNLSVRQKPIGLTNPAISNKGKVTLEILVSFDRNCNPIFWFDAQFYEEIGFGAEGLAVSGNVELDADRLGRIAFLAPSIPDKRADNLNVEGGFGLAG